ncbi:MAG: hypothetical protein U1E49_18570 [Hyphomicrobiaceae bacterium]
MKIEISAEHAEALKAAVSAGDFASVDEAVAAALDQLFMSDEDMSWAKPLVAEALAELERGEGIPAEKVFGELKARFARSGA